MTAKGGGSTAPVAADPPAGLVVSLSPFRRVPPWQRALRAAAVPLSVLFHVALAALLVMKPEAATKAATWVEMAVVEPKPPPPPLPPEPEPPKPPEPKKKPPPQAVKFEEIKPPDPTPPPPTPSAEPQPKPARRVLGLSQSSFAQGGNTGLSVAAGNSTEVPQGKDRMGLDEADGPFNARAYTAVTEPPKLKWQPAALVVPEEAKKNRIAGVVEVLVDVGADGKVTRVRVKKDLGFGTGEACADAWRQSTWKPGLQDGQPVGVLGIPKVCTVRLEE